MSKLLFDNELTYVLSTPGYTSVITGASANTVPSTIVDDTLKVESHNGPGTVGYMSLFCRWDDAQAVRTRFLTANSSTAGTYTIYLGVAHPLESQLFCDEVHISPVGKPNGATSYVYARLDCVFRPHTWGGSGTVIRREALVPCGITISVPAGLVYHDGTSGSEINQRSELITSPPPHEMIYIPMWQYTVEVYRVTVLPLATIDSTTNTLNNASMTIQLGGGNTQTVTKGRALYQGIDEVDRTVAYSGDQRWTVKHKWLIGPIDQNMVPNWDLWTTTTAKITDIFVTPKELQYAYANHGALLP